MHLLFALVIAAQAAFSPLFHASDWIGTPPDAAKLSGKTLRQSGRRGCVGIHTPELPFERVRANVVQNLTAQGITWPVAIDNSNVLWNAYHIEYWPTQLIFDRHGVLRKTVTGEGQDELVARTVRELIAERR